MPTLIPGATSSTYTLQPEDEGFEVFCRVKATNSAGFAEADSNLVGPIGPPSLFTPSTWDPTFVSSAFMLLSAGNTVATVDGSSGGFAIEYTRSTQVRTSGKRYFENRIDTNVSLSALEFVAFTGLADNTWVLADGRPGSANGKGWYFQIQGSVLAGAQSDGVAMFPSPAANTADNDVWGFACDIDNHQVTGLYKNGTLLTVTPGPLNWGTGTSGQLFIFCSAQWQGTASTFLSHTLNTAGPFALATLPSGYAAWDS